jgi:hypothetical protein
VRLASSLFRGGGVFAAVFTRASEAPSVRIKRVCGDLMRYADSVFTYIADDYDSFAHSLLSYAAAVATFAYVEGYKAFQLKFSPLVVSRAFTLGPEGGRCTPLRAVLAPFYSMGLFHATRKRKIVSWSVSLAVLLIVGAVKRLPYPWRSIVDAGVVAGLTWGATSIAWIYAKALRGTLPTVSTELPPK